MVIIDSHSGQHCDGIEKLVAVREIGCLRGTRKQDPELKPLPRGISVPIRPGLGRRAPHEAPGRHEEHRRRQEGCQEGKGHQCGGAMGR